MKPLKDPYGIRTEELPIDWDALAMDISGTSIRRARKRSSRKAVRTAIATMAIAIAIGLSFMHPNKIPTSASSGDEEAYDLVPGEIQGDYGFPKSFRALAGYPDTYDASAMHNTIIDLSTREENP